MFEDAIAECLDTTHPGSHTNADNAADLFKFCAIFLHNIFYFISLLMCRSELMSMPTSCSLVHFM